MSRQCRLVLVPQTNSLASFRKSLAFVCIFLLLFSGCAHKRVVTAQQMSPAPEQKPPKNLSEYIRTVMKLSYGERDSRISSDPASAGATLAPSNLQADQNPADTAALLQNAIESLKAGAYLAAFDQLDALEKAEPENAEIQIQLANLWEAWANYPKARSHGERAVALLPQSDQAWEVLGRASLHTRNFAAAVQAYSKALELGPETAARQANLGFAFLEMRLWSQAETHLRRALELDEEMIEARNNLGVALAYLGKPDDAYSEFAKASDPAIAWNNLGVVLREQGLFDDAATAFRRAVELRPDYQKAQLNLAAMSGYLPPPSSVYVSAFVSPSNRDQAMDLSVPEAESPVVSANAASKTVQQPIVRPENPTATVVEATPAYDLHALPKSVSIRWAPKPSSTPVGGFGSPEDLPASALAELSGSAPQTSEIARLESPSRVQSRVYTPSLPGRLQRIAQTVSGLNRGTTPAPVAGSAVMKSLEAEIVESIHQSIDRRTPELAIGGEGLGASGIRGLEWHRALQPRALKGGLSGFNRDLGPLTFLLIGLTFVWLGKPSRRRRSGPVV